MPGSSRKLCQSFVLVCAVIFFVCATPLLKLGVKHTPIYIWWKFKIVRFVWKWSQLFVLAGYVIFFDCAQLGKKLCTNSTFQGHAFYCCGLPEKWNSNCPDRSENYVNRLCWIVLHSSSNWGPKHLLYKVKIENGPIWAKIVLIVCALFVLAGFVIFYDCGTPPPSQGMIKTPRTYSQN